MTNVYIPEKVRLDMNVVADYIREYFRNNYSDLNTSKVIIYPRGNVIFAQTSRPGNFFYISFDFYDSGAIKQATIWDREGDWNVKRSYEDYPNDEYFYKIIANDISWRLAYGIKMFFERYKYLKKNNKNNNNQVQGNPNESLVHRVTENVIRKLRRL